MTKEYWKQRCMAAEKYIDESPCDPDITCAQIEAYDAWRQAVSKEIKSQIKVKQ